MLKYLTPFLWLILGLTIYYIYLQTGGLMPLGFENVSIFIVISFLVLLFIIDLTLKYVLGKEKIGWVWLIELVVAGILAAMIVPGWLHSLSEAQK
jgi:drug/metabolite transporter (DMT)-like permease